MNVFGADLNTTDCPMPDLAGKYSGNLLIVGCGRCVWDDLMKVDTTFMSDCHVMVLNDMGTHFPGRYKHWYSNDDKKLPHWSEGRRDSHRIFHGTDIKYHTNYPGTFGTQWPFHGKGGSGLVACFVGLALGYDNVLLAGVPFDDSGHYYDPPVNHPVFERRKASNFTNETQDQYVLDAMTFFEGKVKSLSGRSKSLLSAESQ